MNQTKIIGIGFLQAIGVGLYVFLVAQVMQMMQNTAPQMDGIFGIAAFLLLFTVSAAICGSIVLGRPVWLFMNNQKKESIYLLLATIGWLVLLTTLLLTSVAFLVE